MTESQELKMRYYFELGNANAVRQEMEGAGLEVWSFVNDDKVIEIRLAPPPDPGIIVTTKDRDRK